ncbi:MAG: cell division protein ZapA [bacterium]|nr:cell division protein ZapA [bacterium]
MSQKTDVEVIINNKKYVICGSESAEYLEKIASYINRQVAALKSEEWYRSLEFDMKNVLLDINIADDYFKAKERINEMQQIQDETNKDLFELKHEIISKQTKLDELTNSYEQLEAEYKEAVKKITELETKLNLSRG